MIILCPREDVKNLGDMPWILFLPSPRHLPAVTKPGHVGRYLSVAVRYSIIAHADALGRAFIDQLYVSNCAK
jgi:hypothetical protein